LDLALTNKPVNQPIDIHAVLKEKDNSKSE